MKNLILLLFILTSSFCTANAQNVTRTIDGETFVIKQHQIDAGCYGNSTIPTSEVYYGDQLLNIAKDQCYPECSTDIVNISFVDVGTLKHVLLIESTGALGNYKSYFIKKDSATWVRVQL